MKNKNLILFAVVLAAALGMSGCSDLKTDLPSPVAPGVQVHRSEWIDTSSAGFHGKVVDADHGNVQECLKCHGLDYRGGFSGISCVKCHQDKGASLHGRGWISTASANFHGNAIRAANWDMRSCQACHGTLYDGGKVGVSCRDCHTGGAGPENCATCHGSANNPAPPRSEQEYLSHRARCRSASNPLHRQLNRHVHALLHVSHGTCRCVQLRVILIQQAGQRCGSAVS